MDRLDENVKEEADGIHNSLGKYNNNKKLKLIDIIIILAIVENMSEFRPVLCVDACKQGLLTCLLKRLKVGKQIE
jgi:beta-catenin-like protein 1